MSVADPVVAHGAGRQCCVSIDVDPLDTYLAGTDAGWSWGRAGELLRLGVTRFLELLSRHSAPATFFVVGRSLGDAPTARLVRELSELGHEVGNHSQNHLSTFGSLAPAQRTAEIRLAHDRLEDVTGCPVVGFRAPAWNISDAALADLVAAGYVYDSSVHPTSVWPLIKAAKRVLSRDRAAVTHLLGDWRLAMAPTRRYRPSADGLWKRGDLPIVEMPVSVLPFCRLPFYGTWLLSFGRAYTEAGLAALRPRVFLNLELHAIELLDYEADGLASLDREGQLLRHPGVRIPLARKRALLSHVLDRLSRRYEFATLSASARDVVPTRTE